MSGSSGGAGRVVSAAELSALSTLRTRASGWTSLDALSAEVAACRRCPRLVAWREQVAITKRASFRDEIYWGRPVPGFGDPEAWLLIVGLAPAAHGANRTGRMFTGDRSGDWLFRALHRAGLANQPEAVTGTDGLKLNGVYITASVRCAPPANKPTTAERDNCRPWLDRELNLLHNVRVIVALGGFAWQNVWSLLKDRGHDVPTPRPKFGHGTEVSLRGASPSSSAALSVIGSYHPSQQNTFTGKLTEKMFDEVWSLAKNCW